ncbi:MAG TPA: hypothetical protein VM013_03570 [Dehalococcoidia bacterium]|nr:hypothetical protein [Dehalococcoidia bacterium]
MRLVSRGLCLGGGPSLQVAVVCRAARTFSQVQRGLRAHLRSENGRHPGLLGEQRLRAGAAAGRVEAESDASVPIGTLPAAFEVIGARLRVIA